jgi:hypothetical protein
MRVNRERSPTNIAAQAAAASGAAVKRPAAKNARAFEFAGDDVAGSGKRRPRQGSCFSEYAADAHAT